MSSTKDIIMKELKEQGLDIAEDMAVSVVNAVFDAIPKLLEQSENQYDDLLIPVLASIKPKIIDLLDKIDGKEE